MTGEHFGEFLDQTGASMNEEPLQSTFLGKEPVGEDVNKSTGAENISGKHPDILDSKESPCSDPVEVKLEDATEEGKAPGGDPPIDWFEPLEDDYDDYSPGRNDIDEDSVAGESERSESIVGSEKASKKSFRVSFPRRRRRRDEGWLDCPALGEGWKRKEVVRRSGSSIGQKDIYYMSPRGDRVRSRVELVALLEGFRDLSAFDFKTGRFYDGDAPARVRNRIKRRIKERSSSESSWVDRGEGADTPDSIHGLTPIQGPKYPPYNPTGVSSQIPAGTSPRGFRNVGHPVEDTIRLPFPSSSSRLLPLPSINGEIGSEDSCLICAKCGVTFTGTWYDKQRKRPCCPTCWAASKTKEHPMIRFRKWIPCGQCVGCHNTVNCGQCANCKHGLQSPESRKRICRKRRCICPIRKGSESFMQQNLYDDISEMFDDSQGFKSEVADSQNLGLKNSDTENFSVNVDVDDDDDVSTDDDDDWHKKRKRRACGECKACLCRKDCGTCDFCVDKPKFGGSNKKRQKCRLRQCQRQAMRHLLPFQMGQVEFGPEGPLLPGRPRPHYTYSRKPHFKRHKGQPGLDLTDNEDDDVHLKAFNHLDFVQRNGVHDGDPHNSSDMEPLRWDAEKSQTGSESLKQADDDEEEEELPMITQIFSLADDSPVSGRDVENQLMKLLQSLRSSVLPILWYAIMLEGPQLQLIQCCKKSHMTDTMVLIDPGFCYQITVQKQPLLPTHLLYDKYPGPLATVNEVVSLLLGLEKYVVCQGLPPKGRFIDREPLILERASTCDFLVKKKVSICSNCRALRRL
ncbi:methyl-CpG-binding domain protein 1b isoform X2 [Antennarius striatus]|uniref:methyl-CpG-binding domain protein 1b isoform X2 n=1 Tax=Antennarius striatus TaxID=241820 RepID=UPI0035B2515C